MGRFRSGRMARGFRRVRRPARFRVDRVARGFRRVRRIGGHRSEPVISEARSAPSAI
nr:hypothetical protein [Saccharothrix obliqua]